MRVLTGLAVAALALGGRPVAASTCGDLGGLAVGAHGALGGVGALLGGVIVPGILNVAAPKPELGYFGMAVPSLLVGLGISLLYLPVDLAASCAIVDLDGHAGAEGGFWLMPSIAFASSSVTAVLIWALHEPPPAAIGVAPLPGGGWTASLSIGL